MPDRQDAANRLDRVAKAIGDALNEVVFGESNEEAARRLAAAAIAAEDAAPRRYPMPEPRETLERVLEAHRPYGLDCKCGVAINSDAWWATHVATVVLAASAWPAVGVRPAAPEPVVDAPQDAPKPQTHVPARKYPHTSWRSIAAARAAKEKNR